MSAVILSLFNKSPKVEQSAPALVIQGSFVEIKEKNPEKRKRLEATQDRWKLELLKVELVEAYSKIGA